MLKRFITLKEIPGRGWLWTEHGRYYKSCADAVKAIKREDKKLANGNSNGGVITMITYEPVTDIGMAVVRALTH